MHRGLAALCISRACNPPIQRWVSVVAGSVDGIGSLIGVQVAVGTEMGGVALAGFWKI